MRNNVKNSQNFQKKHEKHDYPIKFSFSFLAVSLLLFKKCVNIFSCFSPMTRQERGRGNVYSFDLGKDSPKNLPPLLMRALVVEGSTNIT